ncbi:MAG: LytTR family DNA-binding domain-containing protein [Bacteroidota bacterium]
MSIVSLYLEMAVVFVAFILLASYRYDHMVPLAADIPFLAVVLYGIVFLYGFTMLAKRSFANQKRIQDLEKGKNRQTNTFLLVRAERRVHRILQQDIDYLESLGDYVRIHTSTSTPITTKEKISKLETSLPNSFLRIHRSYIVNTHKILSFNKEQIQVKEISLPISRTYKKKVIDALNRNA